MLERAVWSDQKVADRIAKDYIPLWMHATENKDHPGLKKLAPNAGPGMVPYIAIADATGAPIAAWSQRTINMARPFTADDMIKFIDAGVQKIADIKSLEKTCADAPKDRASAEKLAAAYLDLDRAADAAKVYERLISEAKSGDDTTDMTFSYCIALSRANDRTKAATAFGPMFDKFIEKKDQRIADKLATDNDALLTLVNVEDGRKKCQQIVATFPDHPEALNFRCRAVRFGTAALGLKARDVGSEAMQELKKELEAIIATGPESNQWVAAAKRMLTMFSPKKEGGTEIKPVAKAVPNPGPGAPGAPAAPGAKEEAAK